MGLVTDGCVKLGEETTDSCDVDCATACPIGVSGGGFDTESGTVCDCCDEVCDEGPCVVGVDATAAAAAAAYRIGGRAGGRVADGKPALRMLAMGCCAKFGFGGGFTVERHMVSIDSDRDRHI